MEKEVWKDIPGYEGVYQASSFGQIRSVPRIDCGGRQWKGGILSQFLVKEYYVVSLNHAHICKQCKVHRLVAMAFIPNPDNLPYINHKDENKLNNNVSNLEWCTAKYNVTYGSNIARRAKSQSITMQGRLVRPETQKPVVKIDKNTGRIVCEYKSLSEAARQCHLSECKISLVCNDKRKTHGGFYWKFKN